MFPGHFSPHGPSCSPPVLDFQHYIFPVLYPKVLCSTVPLFSVFFILCVLYLHGPIFLVSVSDISTTTDSQHPIFPSPTFPGFYFPSVSSIQCSILHVSQNYTYPVPLISSVLCCHGAISQGPMFPLFTVPSVVFY